MQLAGTNYANKFSAQVGIGKKFTQAEANRYYQLSSQLGIPAQELARREARGEPLTPAPKPAPVFVPQTPAPAPTVQPVKPKVLAPPIQTAVLPPTPSAQPPSVSAPVAEPAPQFIQPSSAPTMVPASFPTVPASDIQPYAYTPDYYAEPTISTPQAEAPKGESNIMPLILGAGIGLFFLLSKRGKRKN